MAKKLVKVPRKRWVVFTELLLPWLFMAAVAVALDGMGASVEVAFGAALVAGLGATGMVFLYERWRKARMLSRASGRARRR